MTAKEKYFEEKDEFKNIRKNRIFSSAFELFSLKGIDTIAMTDIAKKAEIGVASLYRYFETKEEIAIRTAIWIWEKEKKLISEKLFDENFANLSGIEQLNSILKMFVYLYENETLFLRFIYFFDSYAVRTQIEKSHLIDYEKTIISVQSLVENSINKGFEDNSISKEYKNNSNFLYFTLMQTLFSTAQKLSLNSNLLSSDSITSGKKELELLIEIIIKSIKK